MEWQPIETAPRDGSPLLLFARCKSATAPAAIVGWYLPNLGWIEASFTHPVGIVPFYWMPLPPPPNHTPSQGKEQGTCLIR